MGMKVWILTTRHRVHKANILMTRCPTFHYRTCDSSAPVGKTSMWSSTRVWWIEGKNWNGFSFCHFPQQLCHVSSKAMQNQEHLGMETGYLLWCSCYHLTMWWCFEDHIANSNSSRQYEQNIWKERKCVLCVEWETIGQCCEILKSCLPMIFF